MFDQSDQIDKDMADTMANLQEGGSPASSPNTVPDEAVQSPSAASNAGATPAVTPDPQGTPAEQAAWEALPKSWKKEYAGDWPKIEPKLRQYIHERERQALEGIMQYKPVADKWSGTVKPFEQAFKQLGVDPHQIFGSVAQNHMLLKYGTPEQRRAVWDRLRQDYALDEFLQPNSQQVPPQWMARLDHIENAFREKELAAAKTEVEKFFSNPDNEFAKDVATDMNQFLEAGLAADLPTAYELAIWRNPSVRAKLMEREAEKIAGGRPKVREVRSSDTPPSPTGGATETLDETLANTFAKMQSR